MSNEDKKTTAPSYAPHQVFQQVRTQLRRALYVVRNHGVGTAQYWLIAALIGMIAGGAAKVFALIVTMVMTLLYGAGSEDLLFYVHTIPWFLIFLYPVIGGFITGQILDKFTEDKRVNSISQVLEGVALNQGRVDVKSGWASALASLVTLSTGGSSGQEGPVVHMGAVISTTVSRWLRLDGVSARDLMGVAGAAAVASSFNAPFAGALFAFEVILRRYAPKSFGPIAIGAVIGTVTGRLIAGGNYQGIQVFQNHLNFYHEIPAFIILGVISGLVAFILMKSVFIAEDVAGFWQRRFGIKSAYRPVVAGAILGALALIYPQIIGVGYQTTVKALLGHLTFWEVIAIVTAKVVAVAVTLGGRMGGGIFSPSLMVGALTGLAFGIIATQIFPEYSGVPQLYAIAGMAAVAAAVLGAPISTTMIVLEMTLNWDTTLAVMTSVALSSSLANRMVDKSFFLTQAERRGVHISDGPHVYIQCLIGVNRIMRPVEMNEDEISNHKAQGAVVSANDTLEDVLPLFHALSVDSLLVVDNHETDAPKVIGEVFEIDAIRAYNERLVEEFEEDYS